MRLDATTAKLVLRSPSTSPETLADIARDFPDLQAQVATHPAATPDLLDWLTANGTPDAQAAARGATAARLAAPPPAPTAAPDPPAPVQPRHWSKRRRVAVIAGVCAVAIALVVWFAVLPQLANRGAKPAPDLTAQPALSDPIPLPAPQYLSQGQPQVLDPQAGNIAVVYSGSGNPPYVQAFDLAAKTKLWGLTRADGITNALAASGFVVLQENEKLEVIDARRGTTTATVSLSGSEMLSSVQAGMIITTGGATVCGRAIANPGVCRWKADTMGGFFYAFAGNHWIDVSGNVLDLQTGEPAAFGSDVTFSGSAGGQSLVFYDGRDQDHVVRWTVSQQNWDPATGQVSAVTTVQPWDTVNNRGLFPAVTSGVLTVDPGDSMLIADQTAGAATQLTAYDWQTGATKWQSSVTWQFSSPAVIQSVVCARSLLLEASNITTDGQSTTTNSSQPTAINTQTGQQVWQSATSGYYVGSGSHVVYILTYDAQGSSLAAFDAASPSFQSLWTLPLPSGAMPQIVAGHIVATSATQLWVIG